MSGLKQTIIRGGLEGLYFTGAHMALKPFVSGVGAILTLHHVRPPRPGRFQPNRLLEVTPRFLTRVVKYLRRSGVDLVGLDEMHRRLSEGDFARRFVCLTFDDGYRDTMQWAYPILKEAGVPFAIYVPTSFPDRLGELWWLALEAVIAKRERIGLVIAGENRTFACETVAEKRALYDELYWWLRARESEAELRAIVRDLAARYQVDIAAFCKDLCMSWQEIALLARDPLVTIGAHTVNHLMLAKLPEKTVRAEMDLSRTVIEAALGARPAHLSYPYGDPGWSARIRHRRRTRFQDGSDDAARRSLPHRRRGYDRTAAHLAQRRISAAPLCARAALRLGDGDVERLSRRAGCLVVPLIPAKAGIQPCSCALVVVPLDSRLRGNERMWV